LEAASRLLPRARWTSFLVKPGRTSARDSTTICAAAELRSGTIAFIPSWAETDGRGTADISRRRAGNNRNRK